MSTSPVSSTFKSGSFQVNEASGNVPSSTNTHPYAIKSSSSAILSRNNSISNPATRHHYVPLSRIEPEKTGSKKRRYIPSKALDNVERTGGSAFSEDTVLIPSPISIRVKRRDTLPSSFGDSGKTTIPEDIFSINPKQWTSYQLAAYLSSMLRLRGGVTVPLPVMRDITAFVVKQRLDGRMFLKMTREDYNVYDINPLWKEALVNASLTLRQNLLQGQVFGSLKPSALSAENLVLLSETERGNDIPPSPTNNTPGAYVPWDRRRTLGRLQAGRVKGIAHKYERSYSEGETSPISARREGSLESESECTPASSPVEWNNLASEKIEVTDSPLLSSESAFHGEEPTMNKLIQEQDRLPKLWGAKAWESEEKIGPLTARKISWKDGSAEEILSVNTNSKDHASGSLASLFSSIVLQTDDNEVESLAVIVGNTEENSRISEDVTAPINSTPQASQLCNDINTSTPGMKFSSISDPSLGSSSEFSNCDDIPPVEASSVTENTKPLQPLSLREVLRALQDRLEVVEKRLIDLEALETTTNEFNMCSGMEGRPSEGNNKVKLNVFSHDCPSTLVTPTADSQRSNTRKDVAREDINHRKLSNYASSDFSVYGYIFYASIGLAAMVLDRTFFGRKNA